MVPHLVPELPSKTLAMPRDCVERNKNAKGQSEMQSLHRSIRQANDVSREVAHKL